MVGCWPTTPCGGHSNNRPEVERADAPEDDGVALTDRPPGTHRLIFGPDCRAMSLHGPTRKCLRSTPTSGYKDVCFLDNSLLKCAESVHGHVAIGLGLDLL